VAVDAGFTCPNRDGTKGKSGCIYCNEKGSGAEYIKNGLPLEEQIVHGINLIKRRYKAKKFIIYFQPFSNTYASLSYLRKIYDVALSFDDVLGISIGTRPDCLNEDVIDIIEEYSKRTYLWLEIGLQSIHNKTLKLIRRGHTYQDFLKAYYRVKKRNIRTCFHVIIGLPGESKEEILQTAKEVARLEPEGIKIHSLYIEKGTVLEKMFKKNPFKVFDMEEYIRILVDFLELLPYKVIIQRVIGESNKNKLVAPDWILKKQEVMKKIDQEFLLRGSWQGKKYNSAENKKPF